MKVIHAVKKDKPILIYVSFFIMITLQLLSGINIQPKNVDPTLLSLLFILIIGIFVQVLIFKYKIPSEFVIFGIGLIAILMACLIFFLDFSSVKIDVMLWISLNLLSFVVAIPIFYYFASVAAQVNEKEQEKKA